MALADPTVRGQELGEELRALRETSGWSLTTAGQRIDASASKICRIESGRVTATPEDVAALLAVYGVTGPQRRELLELAREAEKRGWWQRHLLDYQTCRNTLFNQEAKASTIVNFELAVIPGLLQTPGYTRALTRDFEKGASDEEVEARVNFRQQRQARLSQPNPPNFLALIDEMALRRAVGGPEVFQHQLLHLLHAGEHPNITILVVPNDGDVHPGIDGGFIMLRKGGQSSLVYVDNLVSCHYFEEQVEVDEYASAIQRLSDRALDQRESMELIATLANPDDKASSAWTAFGSAAAARTRETASKSPETAKPRRSGTPRNPTDLT